MTTTAITTPPTSTTTASSTAAMPTTSTTSAVSIKPSIFCDSNPTAWFHILEAQFHLAGVTNPTTKYYHALSHIPASTVGRLSATILSGTNYDDLKTAVVTFYESSKPELFNSLMSSKTLVGWPSDFLCDIRQVAAKVGVNDDLTRHRFIQALPDSIGPIIAAQQGLTLDQLGRLADELVPFMSRGICSADKAQKVPQTAKWLHIPDRNLGGICSTSHNICNYLRGGKSHAQENKLYYTRHLLDRG